MCGGLLLSALSFGFSLRPYPPRNTSAIRKWFDPDNNLSPLRSFLFQVEAGGLLLYLSPIPRFRKSLTKTYAL